MLQRMILAVLQAGGPFTLFLRMIPAVLVRVILARLLKVLLALLVSGTSRCPRG
jgi:hypothetical protein